jgi:hypothetical protein
MLKKQKNYIKIFLKKHFSKIVVLLLFIMNHYYSAPVLMEPEIENDNDLTEWLNWFWNYKYKIAFLATVIVLIFYLKPDVIPDITVPSIDIIANALEPIVKEPLYDYIIRLTATIVEDPEINKELGLKMLESLLTTASKNDQILNQEKFTDLIILLIEEIAKL